MSELINRKPDDNIRAIDIDKLLNGIKDPPREKKQNEHDPFGE